ncbi:hypothetical protein [Rhodococcus sp. USK13]|uniref:hypothetical protein n=1 Tax=Rhodococcus sp. USK13 TaxID=2806442 RepID=UPI001BCBB29B|nr:hypothetical protein [Rhodococcus sp. USK13]
MSAARKTRSQSWMDGWTFKLGEGLDLALELDAVSADTAVFMPLVDGDGLADTVDGDLFGTRLVLINHVFLDHALRGHGGVGRYLTGLAIPRLDSAAACVALHASPFELRKRYSNRDVPVDEWEAGAMALGKLWQSLGFKHHSGHLYVLDPSTLALDEAVDELKYRLMQN